VCRAVQVLSGEKAISTNFRYNEQIRISPVFLIDEADNKVGPTPTAEAQRRAREAGLDLVEVAPMARPPVCKIMDYGKWRYQQQKKADKSRASSKAGQLKELVFKTVKIGDHDLMIKVNHAREFLKEGNKVQFTLRFKGREMAHIDLGRDIFTKVKTELFFVSKVERDAKMEGRRMTLVLQPDHKDPATKMPAVITAAKPAGAPRPPNSSIASRAPAMNAGAGLNLPPRPVRNMGPVGAKYPQAAPVTNAAPAVAPRPAAAAAPAPAPAVKVTSES
jgi:translation initiation factor IF-3